MKKETFCKIVNSLRAFSDFEKKTLDLNIEVIPNDVLTKVYDISDFCFEQCFGELQTYEYENSFGEKLTCRVNAFVSDWVGRYDYFEENGKFADYTAEELYDLCIKEYKTCNK